MSKNKIVVPNQESINDHGRMDPSLVKESTPPYLPNKVALSEARETVVINFDELKPNSVIIIKIAPEGMQQRIAATQQIATALRPFRDKIQEKKLAFIIMGTGENMEVLDEEQMNAIGWFKKEKSVIITPF